MIGFAARGAIVGTVVSAISWVAALLSRNPTVSTFPDVVSLATLVVLSAIAMRVRLRPAVNFQNMVYRAVAVGAVAGCVVGAATAARSATREAELNPRMLGIAFVLSFLGVVITVSVTGVAAFLIEARKRSNNLP